MIFAVTNEQHSLGPHFLIWSIHINDLKSQKNSTIANIPSNPLVNKIAHKMPTNHCRTIESAKQMLELFNSKKELNHIRYSPMATSIKQQHEDNAKFQKILLENNVKIVNLTCTGLQHLTGFLRWNGYEEPDWQNKLDKIKEHCKHYWPQFFDNAEIFQSKLDSLHDIRENIAFNLRPNDYWQSFNGRNTNKNIYHYQFEDFVLHGKETMIEIMKFLKLSYDETYYDEWCKIHDQWSQNVKNYVYFCNDIEHIVESIISNKSINLEKYQMNVLKEGVLLHFLMYKHDLNFNKAIEKLPLNTQEIYSLLGKNQRTGIEKLYI